jgi:CubicO group peptidase (beta-lactamase class C family)
MRASRISAAHIRAMEEDIGSGQTPKISSVLIARHGKLAYEAYFDGSTAAALRDTRSVTKSVTGLLVGIAIDRGLLSGVGARVQKFFPDKEPVLNPHPQKEKITVEDLLTMSSALYCDDKDKNSPGHEDKMYETQDWVRFALDLPVGELPGGARRRGGAAPGRVFRYCTAGVTTLGGVLERASGASVVEFARKNLFDPLGIEQAEWQFSPTGQAQTGGGLRLRSRDLLKLGQLYANGGVWNGTRVVSADWVSASARAHVRVDDETEYGYLWWLREFQSGGKKYAVYYMAGNGGNKVAVVPELEAVVTITSTNYNAPGMHERTDRLLSEYILASLTR